MKILIHYGYAKTGSSSLQSSLMKNRKLLAKSGILYPVTSKQTDAHHVLLGLFKSEACIPPYLIDRYDGYENLTLEARKAWKKIKRNVALKKPEVLLLSSEMFFGYDPGGEQQKLFDHLSEISNDIEPIVYIRDPADHFLSIMQQRARFSAAVVPPSAERIRSAIENLEAVYGKKPAIRAFEQGALAGGDIVQDFAQNFLSVHIEPSRLNPMRLNESMSPETMLITHNFRRVNCPGSDGVPTPKSWRLFHEVRQIDKEIGKAGKPQLPAGLADQIRRASVDYTWLKDRYGVSFKNLDYSQMDDAPIPMKPEYQKLSGLIDIDWERYDRLLYTILSREMEADNESRLIIGNTVFRPSNITKKLGRLKSTLSKIYGKIRP